MKNVFRTLVCTALLFTGTCHARSTAQRNLSTILLNAETIVSVRIIRGNCELAGCKENLPHLVYSNYSFECISAIFGSCPKKTSFRSGQNLCIGCSYILIGREKDNNPGYLPLELRHNGRHVVFDGYMWGLPYIKLYQREGDFEGAVNYSYYEYSDFLSSLKAIKSGKR